MKQLEITKFIDEMLEDGLGNLHIAFEQLKENYLSRFIGTSS